MSEMIERVAKAMAENAGFCWEHCAQSQWKSDARAGIEVMREPMGLVCMHGITMSDKPSHTCVCHTAFSVLIDVALSS